MRIRLLVLICFLFFSPTVGIMQIRGTVDFRLLLLSPFLFVTSFSVEKSWGVTLISCFPSLLQVPLSISG